MSFSYSRCIVLSYIVYGWQFSRNHCDWTMSTKIVIFVYRKSLLNEEFRFSWCESCQMAYSICQQITGSFQFYLKTKFKRWKLIESNNLSSVEQTISRFLSLLGLVAVDHGLPRHGQCEDHAGQHAVQANDVQIKVRVRLDVEADQYRHCRVGRE